MNLYKWLPLEGKLSAKLTDEVSSETFLSEN